MKKYIIILSGFLAFIIIESCKKSDKSCWSCHQYFAPSNYPTKVLFRDTICGKNQDEINKIMKEAPNTYKGTNTQFYGAPASSSKDCDKL